MTDRLTIADQLHAELSHYVCASYPWPWSYGHSDPTDGDTADARSIDDADESEVSIQQVISELTDRRRIDKLAEELGEAVDAYGSYVGENPRKRNDPAFPRKTLDDVKSELLDVALCALGAFDHLDGHSGTAFLALLGHADARHTRAGLKTGVRARMADAQPDEVSHG